jgi:hypothetical protein
MLIVKEYPPNINEISKRFKITSSVIFAYGDTIYNPSGAKINKALIAHEETHSRQQEKIGVERWWDKYLSDYSFRLSQEVEAYGAQMKEARKGLRSYAKQQLMLSNIARDLSSELYGNVVSYSEAIKLINHASL